MGIVPGGRRVYQIDSNLVGGVGTFPRELWMFPSMGDCIDARSMEEYSKAEFAPLFG